MVLYVYAIIDGAKACGSLPDTGILPGIPVKAVAYGDLSCIVSEVPDAIFEEAPLREMLEQSEWTKELALSHERVVAALMPNHTVLPLKFCTLFNDQDSMNHVIGYCHEGFKKALSHIRGANEWGVKLFYDPMKVQKWVEQSAFPDAPPVQEPPGVAFFARKQRERLIREKLEQSVIQCAADAHKRLTSLSRSAGITDLHPPALHGRADTMALNGVYLIESQNEVSLKHCIQDLTNDHSANGFDFILTGPWAPYHFTEAGFAEEL